MKKNKQQTPPEIPQWAKSGHAKPVTRRDFLSHGIIPFAAAMAMPNWLNILGHSPSALAQMACPAPGSSMIPFVSLSLAGGAGMAGNYVPVDGAGDLLPSYSKMGLGDNKLPISTEFGNVPFAGAENGVLISKMLQGIREMAKPTTLAKTAFISFCSRSRDDSSQNHFNIAGLLAQAGLNGSQLPNIGSEGTISGDRHMPALISPPNPLVVRNFSDITNALGYSFALNTNLNARQKVRLAKLVRELNSEQSRKLASNSTEIKGLLDCAGIRNEDLLSQGTADSDPLTNPAIATLWGLAANTNKGSENYTFGAMAYNAISGKAGSASLTRGGYDYHDNTRTTGDARDLTAGQQMGRILETAAILGKPVCLYVTTDGAVVSTESAARNSAWVSDRGIAGVSFLMMFDPAGRPATTGFQVGSFNSTQTVEDKTIIGSNPEIAAQAAFANYLQFNKKLQLFSQVIPQRGLSDTELKQVVKVV